MTETVSLADFWQLFALPIAGSLLSAALCGYLGFFVVLRRVAFVSAALGQVSGLGVALGFWVGSFFGAVPHGATPFWLNPVLFALLLTGGVSAALATVSRVQRTTPESAVAFAYLAAAALALIVLNSPRLVQETHEVGDLLIGNGVTIRREHFTELLVVAAVVLTSHLFLFKDLTFTSFDREMAQTLGLPVRGLDLWLVVSVGLSVAVCTRAVGALPVFAFLVLPAGAALLVSERIAVVIGLSVAGAVLAAGAGFWLSYLQSTPTGPTMVVISCAYWPLAVLVRLLSRRQA